MCWIKTPIHGAFNEFYAILQLQILKYNFNVASAWIWNSQIILIEYEIMMQHSRPSSWISAMFQEKLFSANKNPCYSSITKILSGEQHFNLVEQKSLM